MLMDAKETYCREELVKQIKDVGEELDHSGGNSCSGRFGSCL